MSWVLWEAELKNPNVIVVVYTINCPHLAMIVQEVKYNMIRCKYAKYHDYVFYTRHGEHAIVLTSTSPSSSHFLCVILLFFIFN
jgi:hypothetical protein